MTSASKIASNIGDLIALPEAYLKVREIMSDNDYSMDDISKIIENDPGMCSKVLRLANSAFFGFSQKVDSIHRAITIMGADQLQNLLLASSVSECLNNLSTEELDSFWRYSAHCAITVQLLAKKYLHENKTTSFIIGLLHAIGEPVIRHELPEKAKHFHRDSFLQKKTIAEVQSDILGFNYAELSYELLLRWKLPENILVPIRYHLAPRRTKKYQPETEILHITSILIKQYQFEQSSEKYTLPVFDENVLNKYKIERSSLPNYAVESESELVGLMFLLDK